MNTAMAVLKRTKQKLLHLLRQIEQQPTHDIIQVSQPGVCNCIDRLLVSVCQVEYLTNPAGTCLALSLIVYLIDS